MHSLGHVNFHTYLTEVIVYQIVVVLIARWCYHLESPYGPMVLSSIRNRSVGILVVCKERLPTAIYSPCLISGLLCLGIFEP